MHERNRYNAIGKDRFSKEFVLFGEFSGCIFTGDSIHCLIVLMFNSQKIFIMGNLQQGPLNKIDEDSCIVVGGRGGGGVFLVVLF